MGLKMKLQCDIVLSLFCFHVVVTCGLIFWSICQYLHRVSVLERDTCISHDHFNKSEVFAVRNPELFLALWCGLELRCGISLPRFCLRGVSC